MSELFDVNDTSDLPEELRKSIAQSNALGNWRKKESIYLSMVREAGRAVTADEVRAAIYRKTGNLKSKQATYSSLLNLKTTGKITQPKRGWWEIA